MTALPSRYVRRCERCRQVKGNSSFRGQPGDKGTICRVCADRETNRKRALREQVKRLAQLRVTERGLARQLEKVRLRIKTLEHEAEAYKSVA